MSKELEEAIKFLKNVVKTQKDLENCKTTAFYKKENSAIETVLQALDNSIPKEKVKKKIEGYRNERKELADGHFWDSPENINKDTSLFIAGETLKLLLEGK